MRQAMRTRPTGMLTAVAMAISAQDAVRGFLLGFTRTQEASAGEASVRYLVRAGINPQAAVDVLKMFRGLELLSISRQDPYLQTHPLTSKRQTRTKAYAAKYKDLCTTESPTIKYWYARMVTKFQGFTGNASRNLRQLKKSDKAAAAKSCRRAAQLAPKEALILGGLGRALLAVNSKRRDNEALKVLKPAYARDPADGFMLRNLALAYARTGQNGMASVVIAQRYALQSNFKQAEIHAKRAQRMLPAGTVGWLQADDILVAAKRLQRRK